MIIWKLAKKEVNEYGETKEEKEGAGKLKLFIGQCRWNRT